MGIVEGGPEELAAGQVLPCGGNAPQDPHGRGIYRVRGPETRQGRPVGTDKKDGFRQIALRLLDRQRGEFPVVERAFGHDPVHGKPQLSDKLIEAQLGNGRIAAAFPSETFVGGGNGLFPTFDRYIHEAFS